MERMPPTMRFGRRTLSQRWRWRWRLQRPRLSAPGSERPDPARNALQLSHERAAPALRRGGASALSSSLRQRRAQMASERWSVSADGVAVSERCSSSSDPACMQALPARARAGDCSSASAYMIACILKSGLA